MTALDGVYGAGGCGRGVMPIARAQLGGEASGSFRFVFIDDGRAGSRINGHEVMSFAEFASAGASTRSACVAIADGATRARIAGDMQRRNVSPWSGVAESAVVMDDVTIGEGAAISPFVTLTSNIRIGRHFHANLYCHVEHDCVIGDFVTFAPGVKCDGNVIIEDGAYIGSGAMIKQDHLEKPMQIGRGAIVGMGAVVTRDVPAGMTVVGNPARSLSR